MISTWYPISISLNPPFLNDDYQPLWGYRAPASGLAPSGAQYTFYGASNVPATPNPAMWQPGMMPPSGSFLAEKCEESGGFFWEWIAGCFTKEKTDKLICLAPERSVILAVFWPNKTSHELTVYIWLMFSVRLLAALGHSVIHVHRYGYTKKNMLRTSPDLWHLSHPLTVNPPCMGQEEEDSSTAEPRFSFGRWWPIWVNWVKIVNL